MSAKRKSVVMRAARTAVATMAGLVAVWITGPEVTGAIEDPVVRAGILVVVAPALMALDKALRLR